MFLFPVDYTSFIHYEILRIVFIVCSLHCIRNYQTTIFKTSGGRACQARPAGKSHPNRTSSDTLTPPLVRLPSIIASSITPLHAMSAHITQKRRDSHVITTQLPRPVFVMLPSIFRFRLRHHTRPNRIYIDAARAMLRIDLDLIRQHAMRLQ